MHSFKANYSVLAKGGNARERRGAMCRETIEPRPAACDWNPAENWRLVGTFFPFFPLLLYLLRYINWTDADAWIVSGEREVERENIFYRLRWWQ